ncbi:MAG: indolepyruvate/phenylpyruvate decarboxylase [Alphaproteobacteria bacterium]|nr:indolepyruvate/phenylpyruvate decarboxylase [Alphaproteobacteria bacterium]
MTLTESLLDALKRAGAREIFGIPGDFALPLFREIERCRTLDLYTLSHEPAVGFAADAAARFRCAPSVAAVTYGAGAFNVVNAIAGAYAERSPVVVISGAPARAERERGLLLHHQARTLDSQFRVFQEITCDQAVLDDPATAPERIARVLRSCVERSLPVYIEVPRDMPAVPCGPVPVLAPSKVDAEAVAACAADVLETLARAKAPVLLACVEVRRYGLEEKVGRLARRLGIPLVTTFMGRGLFSQTDSALLGTYLGVAGKAELTELVEGSDALLMLGVIVSDTNFGISAQSVDIRHAVHAFDRQVRIAHRHYPQVPLGDLVDALLDQAKGPLKGRIPNAAPATYPAGLVADGTPIVPQDIARAVNDLMQAKGRMPIASDVGDCLFTAMDIDPTDLTGPGYYAGMGFGVPAGLGIAAATGRRPLILVGDGAFQMTGWELGNCKRYGWDPIVVVFNNASWEMLRAFEPDAKFNDLDDWPFAKLAENLGGTGRRVRTRAELQAALAAAHAERGRFQLIEAMLPRGAMSDTLARFVAGVKRLRK